MTVKALIVSDRPDYRQLLAHHVTLEWRDALPAEYEPAKRGRLQPAFRGSVYDVVLLDHEVQEGRGLEWLEDLSERAGFPPIVYFAPQGDERGSAGRRVTGARAARVRSRAVRRRAARGARRAAQRARGHLARRARAAAARPLRLGADPRLPLRAPARRRRLLQRLPGRARAHRRSRGCSRCSGRCPTSAEGSTTFDRFLREYDLAARLDHPNIARIHDLGVADDHVYLAMEYFPGGDLRSRMGAAAAAGARRSATCGSSRRALGALHAVGVLHRDVKPGNVLLRGDGSIAFIDFGLARQLGLESDITGNGAIFGTPHYMSPEQGHGLALDGRSDLYSLGIVLHEMLTGEKPFRAETPLAVIYMHANEPLPRLPQAARAPAAAARRAAREAGRRTGRRRPPRSSRASTSSWACAAA